MTAPGDADPGLCARGSGSLGLSPAAGWGLVGEYCAAAQGGGGGAGGCRGARTWGQPPHPLPSTNSLTCHSAFIFPVTLPVCKWDKMNGFLGV